MSLYYCYINLRSQGYAVPDGHNAADHWMDLLVPDSSLEEEESDRSISDTTSRRDILQNVWDNEAVAIQMDLLTKFQSNTDNDTVDEKGGKYNTSWWTQFTTLTSRALKKNTQSMLNRITIGKTAFIGVAVGVVYFDMRYTEKNAQNIFAYFFITILLWIMATMMDALFAFPQERVVVLKERATASYRLSAYFVATSIAELPVFLFMPFIFMAVSYTMIVPTLGFATFIYVLLITFLSVMTGQSLGSFIGVVFDDIQIGSSIAMVASIFLMLLGSFFNPDLPSWLSWAQYMSPYFYASNAALLVIFQAPIPCDGSGRFCEVDDTTSSFPANEFLDTVGVKMTIGANIGFLLLFIFIPRILAYIIMRGKKAGERE